MAATTERCPWCGSTISHDKFLQIQNSIREEERRKLALAEKTLKAQMEQKLFAERKAIAAERAKLAQVAAQAEKQRQKELAEVRRILQKDREQALLKKDAEFARERDAMQKKISDMTRQIARKSPADVAEGAEIDLYDELRAAFPDDEMVRVQRGKTGGTILQEVRYKGTPAGRILIDSKQRAAWQHAFATKLRQWVRDGLGPVSGGSVAVAVRGGVVTLAMAPTDLLARRLAGSETAAG